MRIHFKSDVFAAIVVVDAKTRRLDGRYGMYGTAIARGRR